MKTLCPPGTSPIIPVVARGRRKSRVSGITLHHSLLHAAIFNSKYFSLIATDAEGVIQIFNAGAERMLGYAAADVIDHMSPASLSDPDELLERAKVLSLESLEPIAAGFEALVFKARRGIEDIYELNYVCRDGALLPAVVSVTALRDPDDGIIGYLLIGTDNSARHQAELVLARHRLSNTAHLERFRSAMDATADAIMLIRRSTMKFIEVNATACSMLGYTRDEFFAMHPLDLCDQSSTIARNMEQEFDTLIEANGQIQVRPAVLCCRDGSSLTVELHLLAQLSGQEWIIVATITDVTERIESARQLHQLAYYDTVTGVPNRRFFNEKLGALLADMPSSGLRIAVLYIDLDHFKNVNDSMGHAAGDALLAQFSTRLRLCVRADDTVCRLGGDEFGLILAMRDGAGHAPLVAAKIKAALEQPFQLDQQTLSVTASIGITLCPDDSSDPETLLRYADTAMYEAKVSGRNSARFFVPGMDELLTMRVALDAALRMALAKNQFFLLYQPRVDTVTGALSGVEALLRWRRPGVGIVLPESFMSSLEQTGFIVEVGAWVIDEACTQLRAWRGGAMRTTPIAINIGKRQFVGSDLCALVVDRIDHYQVSASLLELELTEATLIVDIEQAITQLQCLQAAGVSVSIDDFGTGHSGFAHLRRFPVDRVKIDRSFIRDMRNHASDAAIVRAIIDMAHSLQLNVVAEGVETAAQLTMLRHYQCDQIQGWYVGAATDADVLAAWWGAL